MIEPSEVQCPEVTAYDTILDRLRETRDTLAVMRAVAFTRAYDRARKQAKVANRYPAQTRTQSDSPPQQRRRV